MDETDDMVEYFPEHDGEPPPEDAKPCTDARGLLKRLDEISDELCAEASRHDDDDDYDIEADYEARASVAIEQAFAAIRTTTRRECAERGKSGFSKTLRDYWPMGSEKDIEDKADAHYKAIIGEEAGK